MSKVKQAQRLTTASQNQINQVATAFNSLPWNYNACLMRKKVENLESPVPIEKYFPLQKYVSLFKDFAESIQTFDYDTISNIVEPSFRQKLLPKLDIAEKMMNKYDLEFKIQNERKNDSTDFFLYNVENYLLCGTSVDRTQNKGWESYIVSEDESFQIGQGLKDQSSEIKGTQIVNNEGLTESTKALVVMRLHFCVNTFLNIYLWDPSEQQPIIGHIMKEREMHNKQTHLLTIDKIVAEVTVGSTFAGKEQQEQDQAITLYPKDKGIYITDFDYFMEKGNPIVKSPPKIHY